MRLPTAILLAAALFIPSSAEAQIGLLNATGYGSLGLAAGGLAGYAIDPECEGSSFLCIPVGVVFGAVVGTATGIIVGVQITNAANRKVEAGEALSGAHAGGLVVGTLLGGAVLGGAITAQAGGDGATGLGAAVGVGLGIVLLRSRWDAFTGTSVAVQPGVVGRKAGLVATVEF